MEKTMNDKYKSLRKPLTAFDIELRVGTVGEKGASLLLYKTARVDSKRFDDIFGGWWKREHYIDGKGNVVCKISIYDTDLKEWISREDVGTESNTEKEKGAYSDAFKRASSAWGSGAELYDAPFIFIICETVGKGEKNQYGKYKSYELKDRYFFNEASVSQFNADNGTVKVEIKKGHNVLFTNFISQQDVKPTPPKTEAPKQVEVINEAEFKVLQKLIDDADTNSQEFLTLYNKEQKLDIKAVNQVQRQYYEGYCIRLTERAKKISNKQQTNAG